MSFESTVLAVLRGNSGVTALVPAAKIYFGHVHQNTTAPFIGCFRISTTPSNTADTVRGGAARLDNIQLQVTVYCATEAATHAAANAIRTAMENATQMDAWMVDRQGAFDDPTDLQGQILTFSCWHDDS